MVPVLVLPRLGCACLQGYGEGETESQQDCKLAKLAQGRGHERGI